MNQSYFYRSQNILGDFYPIQESYTLPHWEQLISSSDNLFQSLSHKWLGKSLGGIRNYL